MLSFKIKKLDIFQSYFFGKVEFRNDEYKVNIQNQKGKAKPYQVKQVLLAIDKLEVGHGS